MLSILLLILPTAYTLAITGGNLADSILKKQNDCVDIERRTGNVVDEGDDIINKCKENLDKLKLEYMSKFLLNPSFYDGVFPARLSNGTLIMLTVPSNKETQNIPDKPSCSSCEGLCMVHEKCLRLLDDIKQNADPSEKSYYKMKYGHCLQLLTEQKQKYIAEHNISEDMSDSAGHISVQCQTGTVIMPLPRSEKRLIGKLPNDRNNNYDESHTKEIDDDKNKNGNERENSNKYNINSITKTEHVIDLPKTKSITKMSSNDESLMSQSYYKKDKTNSVNDKDSKMTPHYSIDKESINTRSLSSSADGHKKEPTEFLGKISIKEFDDAVNDLHKTSDKEFHENDHNKDPIDDVLLVNMKRDTKNTANTASDLVTDDNNDSLSPFNKLDTSQNTASIDEPLGDKIIKTGSYCEGILRKANEDYRTIDSVQFYDKQYAKCMKYLNTLKKKYAKMHGIQLTKYKSIFPIVLSSGVQSLVSLPGEIPQAVEPQSMPPYKNPSTSGLFMTQTKDGNIGEKSATDDLNNGARNTDRVSIENPAFISNERFYQYFRKTSDGDNVSTLFKFTKMIHDNTGQSERNSY